MSASDNLYDGLEQWLSQHYSWRDQRYLKVLIYMVRVLLYSGSVNLTKWSSYLPNRDQYAQSQQRRLSRWLNRMALSWNVPIFVIPRCSKDSASTGLD